MSDVKYEYEHKFVINAPRSQVLEDFLDYKSYPEWQSSLQEAILVQGSIDQEGRVVTLVFGSGEQSMKMNETILSMKMPHEITMEYLMGTTRNIQTNYFDHFGAKTVWTVHTEFFFASEPSYSEDVFKETTERGLKTFVDYVETR